jgi:hypothetical protein
MEAKRKKVAEEKINPGVSSVATSKHLYQTIKRCLTVHQCSIILTHTIAKVGKKAKPPFMCKE